MTRFPLKKALSHRLDNGLKCILYPWHDNKIICLQIHIKVGSAWEDKSERALSHFVEHLTFKSTSSYPHNSITDTVSSMGASINAYTDFDSTCYYLLVPSEHLEKGIEILSEIAWQARFNQMDLEMERDVIIEEIRQYDSDPETVFSDFIQYSYFHEHPLKHPVIGFAPQIKAVTLKRVQGFYSKYYRPDNSYIVACGSYDQSEFLRLVERYFGSWTSDNSLMNRKADTDPPIYGFRSFVLPKKIDTKYLAFTLPELSELHPYSEHFLLGMRYLAIGKSSLLHKRLVIGEKLCSSVRVLSLSGLHSGISVILISPVSKAFVPRIIKIVADEFKRCTQYPIPQVDFELIKRDTIHSWLHGFDGMENLASGLAADELLGDYQKLYSYDQRLDKIDAESLPSILQNYWSSDSINVYYSGPDAANRDYVTNLDKAIFANAKVSCHNQDTQELPKLSSRSKELGFSLTEIGDDLFSGVLETGLRFVYKRSRKRPLTGFALSTDYSQLMEDKEHRGHNLFTTTSMLYGTAYRNHDQIMAFSRYLGLNLRVLHHLDCTCWRGKCFHPDLQASLDLLAEIITKPSFEPHYLSVLKNSSIDALRREKDQPASLAYNRWFRLAFGARNNLDRSTGNISAIRSIKAKDLANWHGRLLDPHRFVLAIVGDYEPDALARMISKAFSSFIFLPGPNPLQAHAHYRHGRIKRLVETAGEDQAIIHMGGIAPPAEDIIGHTAFYLLGQAIGGEIGSRFYNILREKYSLTYQAGFDHYAVSDLGFWTAYAFCDPKDYSRLESLMKDIIGDISIRGLHADELSMSKSYLIGMQRFDYESASWMASALSNLGALGYAPSHFFSREARLESISLDQVNDLARDYLIPKQIYTHVLV